MTIIHLLVGLGGGGAEHFVLELAKKNKQDQNKVIVVGITAINLIESKFRDNNIECISLNINKPSMAYAGFKRLLQILRKNRHSIVHAHMFHAGMLACMSKLFIPSIVIVFTLHTNYVKQFYRKSLIYLTKSMRDADVIFSEDSKKWYHKSCSSVIQNGIETTKFNLEPQLSKQFTCLFLGRLEEPKNPLYLIDLVLQLKEKYRFVIKIAGDGGLKEELKRKIAIYKLEPWFDFLGFRSDIPELLSSSHCMIMPSLWEGMPISILEAGAAGVPIVATPVGSIPSILNEQNAYLGKLDAFHLKLGAVMDDYSLAEQKALELKSLILKKYDIANSADKHQELYSKLYQLKGE